MTFQQARAAMALGLKVYFTGWNPEEIVYLYLVNGWPHMHRFSYARDDYYDVPCTTEDQFNPNNNINRWEIYREPKTSTNSSDAGNETSQRKVDQSS